MIRAGKVCRNYTRIHVALPRTYSVTHMYVCKRHSIKFNIHIHIRPCNGLNFIVSYRRALYVIIIITTGKMYRTASTGGQLRKVTVRY